MTQQEFFEHVLKVLNDLDIKFMVTGSVGAMLFGEPRMTNDMDVVVDIRKDKAAALSREFTSEEFYFPPVEAIEADIDHRGQFNILHVESGSKVDLIIKKDTDFARTEFSRMQTVAFSEKMEASSASPEDIIISKLKYYDEGGSEKHIRDVRGMLDVSGDDVDRLYIRKWIKQLGLDKHLSKFGLD